MGDGLHTIFFKYRLKNRYFFLGPNTTYNREDQNNLLYTSFPLKVPKREIFDRSDFPDFYIIKSLCGGDFGVKIKNFFKNN